VDYRLGNDLDLDEVIRLYRSCTLGPRRPLDDRARMAAMFGNANLVVTAWDGGQLVGISRALSDFAYVTGLRSTRGARVCVPSQPATRLSGRTAKCAV
jgi:hypothetical protein